MARVKALHTIYRTVKPGQPARDGRRAVPPEVQTIAPGTVFVSDGDELESLKKQNAVEVVSASNKAAKDDGDNGDKPIERMTGEELDAYLASNNIEQPEGWSGMKVAEKRQWLVAKQSDLV